MSWVWSSWLVAVVASFAVLEGHAYLYKTQMLTHWVRLATVAWPWTPYVFGATALVLAVHFWWER